MAHFYLSRHLQALVSSHLRCSLFSSQHEVLQPLSSLVPHPPSHLHPIRYPCSLWLPALYILTLAAACARPRSSRNQGMLLQLRQKTLRGFFPAPLRPLQERLCSQVGGGEFWGSLGAAGHNSSQFLSSWREQQPRLTNPGCLWQCSIILIWILTPCLSLQY